MSIISILYYHYFLIAKINFQRCKQIAMTKARKQNNSVFYKKRGMIGDSLFRCLQLALRNCKTNKVLFQNDRGLCRTPVASAIFSTLTSLVMVFCWPSADIWASQKDSK
ncbi:hypothetical protein T01_14739 [Trichinella spiralis]|uniref:Uncharacterized protein n=1 Tax=Trichinella spiralis TaxID=6334 RepID=A0A0V1AYY2_TRISP|nr:hypothetical protein T01_14739 [Trichinella spiralis]